MWYLIRRNFYYQSLRRLATQTVTMCRITDLLRRYWQLRTVALCLSLRRLTGESNEPTSRSVLTCHVVIHVEDGSEAWNRVGCHQPPSARTGDVPCGVTANWEMARTSDPDLSFRKVGSTLQSCGHPATSMRIDSRAQIIQEIEILALLGR